MFTRTDDPIADFYAYDAELYEAEQKLPKCDYCGKPIVTEECYKIDDMLVCPDCLDNEHKVRTEDYVEYE